MPIQSCKAILRMHYNASNHVLVKLTFSCSRSIIPIQKEYAHFFMSRLYHINDNLYDIEFILYTCTHYIKSCIMYKSLKFIIFARFLR